MNPAYAETAVLGGIMLDNAKYHDCATVLAESHFTTAPNRELWAAIRERVLGGEPADPVTLSDLLPDRRDEIFDLAVNTPSAANVKAWAELVRTNWRRREAVQIGARLASKARESDDAAIDAAIGELLALSATVTDCDFTIKQALHQAFTQISEAYHNGGKLPGITTGLTALDNILGGLHDSDLIVIGARPAAGKTALLLNMAQAAAATGKRCGVVSAEQPAKQLGVRSIALGSRVGAVDLRRGKIDDHQWGRISAAIATTNALPIRIYDRSAITLNELVSTARKWRHAYGLDVLYIDYAQRIRVPGANRIEEVSEVARGLKNLARDLNIPIVSLAQVKANVDTRPDKRPQSGDLANSDELTREADEIVMLYREEVYYTDTNEQGKPVRKGVAELLIEKNRHGPTGYIEAAFTGETMRFADMDDL